VPAIEPVQTGGRTQDHVYMKEAQSLRLLFGIGVGHREKQGRNNQDDDANATFSYTSLVHHLGGNQNQGNFPMQFLP
jgi:hypothetical protein